MNALDVLTEALDVEVQVLADAALILCAGVPRHGYLLRGRQRRLGIGFAAFMSVRSRVAIGQTLNVRALSCRTRLNRGRVLFLSLIGSITSNSRDIIHI